MTRTPRIAASAGLTVCLGLAASAHAQTAIAGDDFDGGGNFLTRSFTPDNSGSTGFGGPSPTFGDSNFDLFGIGGRNGGNNGLPFDVLDDSREDVGNPNSFAPDDFGFIGFGPDDVFGNSVILADTVNAQNPGGVVNAQWTFDTSGYEQIEISIDFVAFGRFETNDQMLFEASFDGGPRQSVFDVGLSEDDAAANIPYTVRMDNDIVMDRYFNTFFEEGIWQDVVDGIPTPGISFSDTDADQDGLDDVTGERVYQEEVDLGNDGTVDFVSIEAENELYQDPLFVNGTSTTGGVQLGNEFQTVTASIAGTGDLLTLDFTGLGDGSKEIMAFDNIVITGVPIGASLAADFNGDSAVDLADLTILGNGFGAASGATLADGDANGDEAVDLADLTILGNEFGQSADPVAVIPEPTTLAVFGGLAIGLVSRRRRA